MNSLLILSAWIIGIILGWCIKEHELNQLPKFDEDDDYDPSWMAPTYK